MFYDKSTMGRLPFDVEMSKEVEKMSEIQEKGARRLLELGFTEIPCKSRKYRAFQHPGKHTTYFIGKRGALRAGENASKSISLGTVYRLLEGGKK